MGRPTHTGVLTCPLDSFGNPRPNIITTPGETWVTEKMLFKDRKGVGIWDRWETDAFGRHKRWFIKPGYSLRRVPKVKKPASDATTKRASNPIPNGENGGLSDG